MVTTGFWITNIKWKMYITAKCVPQNALKIGQRQNNYNLFDKMLQKIVFIPNFNEKKINVPSSNI